MQPTWVQSVAVVLCGPQANWIVWGMAAGAAAANCAACCTGQVWVAGQPSRWVGGQVCVAGQPNAWVGGQVWVAGQPSRWVGGQPIWVQSVAVVLCGAQANWLVGEGQMKQRVLAVGLKVGSMQAGGVVNGGAAAPRAAGGQVDVPGQPIICVQPCVPVGPIGQAEVCQPVWPIGQAHVCQPVGPTGQAQVCQPVGPIGGQAADIIGLNRPASWPTAFGLSASPPEFLYGRGGRSARRKLRRGLDPEVRAAKRRIFDRLYMNDVVFGDIVPMAESRVRIDTHRAVFGSFSEIPGK